KNFDIYTAIERCRHLLTHFGGHKFAAGLSMEEKDFLEFKRLFEKEVEQSIQAEDLIPEISIDMEIELSDINDKLFRIIRRFEPFGPENSEPLFTTNSIYAYGTGGQKNVRTVGKNHLKFEAISSNKSSKPASCIGFKLGDYCEHLREGKAIAICYSIEENIYNKHRELQLNIRDIKKD
ncbi:MAG: single-stranded-DNA-specific exonuclease RecJ, partial [Bacteroidales bacterium]|nr:single-stranded-DNA-specific exonuclease RecJ [Bacteroidales bacterium]